MLKAIRALDAVSAWSGKVVQWIVIPLMLALGYEVIARYALNAPTIWAYDLSYMLYGGHFMLGAAYALLRKDHIRTDVFYSTWPVRRQAAVDATLYLGFFFPGLVFFLLAGWDAAYHSWSIGETSEVSVWRPVLYPFKAVLPVTAVLLLVQGVSEFLKSIEALRTGRWP
jgi:TRAP-type mannitol/chloroaromatic compound transport system permease small subunit